VPNRGTTNLCLIVALMLGIAMAAVAQESANVSDGRTWGVGVQAGLPYGGLVSVRSWFSPTFGVDGIVFLSGSSYFMEGTLTARALYRVSDADVVDFYLAAGGTWPLQSRTLTLSVLGGIEFGFRVAPALAWNIEFGASYALDGTLNMALGTGLHYYFPGH
jgi:hypothetical protein